MTDQISIDIVIPSSPADRKEIKDALEQLSASMARAEGERDYQKETYKMLSEKFGIEAKYLRRAARDYHKNQFEEKVAENGSYEDFYEIILKS